jgi:mRNA interferase YafQ
MCSLNFTGRFEKDLTLIKKRSLKDLGLIQDFLKSELAIKGAAGLPSKFRVHKLSGNYKDNRDCQVKGNLSVIRIEITGDDQIILVRAGSHSDIF